MMSFHKYFVAGYIYELNLENLKRIPSLILNNDVHMKQFYDPIRQVYCISRNRAFFENLVFYINHGILSRPIDLPLVSNEKRKYKFMRTLFNIGFVHRRIKVSEFSSRVPRYSARLCYVA
jgi:hypothetical protein